MPGLGKTLLVKSLSRALGMSFKRIQFTPDLMPSDIVGTEVLTGHQRPAGISIQAGPDLRSRRSRRRDQPSHASRPNRRCLEAMEEKQVTVFGESHILASPFIVLATQNPIELEGTYRCRRRSSIGSSSLLVAPPAPAELREILKRTTGIESGDATKVLPDDDSGTVNEMKYLLRQVMIAPPIEDYVVRLVHATRAEAQNGGPVRTSVKQYIRFGSSFRAAPNRSSSARKATPRRGPGSCELRRRRESYFPGAAPSAHPQLSSRS